MAKKPLLEAAASLYDVLEPLGEDERIRAISSALVLLGQSPAAVKEGLPSDSNLADRGEAASADETPGLGPKARRWVSQNGISSEMLEQCFHLEPEPPEVVAEVPGTTAKEKVFQCYLLTGIAFFLKTDEPTFEDTVARSVCEHGGCLDSSNHSKYTKFGNKITGDKKKGWKLLSPGLKEAAELIKKITAPAA